MITRSEYNHISIRRAVKLCKWFNRPEVLQDLLSYWFEAEYPKLKLDKLTLTKAREVTKGRILKDYPEMFEGNVEQFMAYGSVL